LGQNEENAVDRTRLWAALPYAVLLAAAAIFYDIAGNIQFQAQPGALGPDFWPKAALALMGLVCLYEIARALVSGKTTETHGIGDALEENEEHELEEPPRRPVLLVAGGALTLAYGVSITTLGFPLATFIYLVVFMYLGGYRAHATIWLSSLVGILAIANLFLNVVYVSLPRGIPPFDRVTDIISSIF
jgi:putative tricarboxylic transport membrane protein